MVATRNWGTGAQTLSPCWSHVYYSSEYLKGALSLIPWSTQVTLNADTFCAVAVFLTYCCR